MTSPGQPKPDDAFTIGTNFGQDITRESFDALVRGQVAPGFEAGADGFRNGIMGGFETLIQGVAASPVIFDLQNRAQKLEGVIGYGSFVMPDNYWSGFGTTDFVLPYDYQVGPSVGITPMPGGNPATSSFPRGVVRLDSRGLWKVDVQAQAGATIYTGNDGVTLTLKVVAPDFTPFFEKQITTYVGRNISRSVRGGATFVLPGPGYFLYIQVSTDNWRWMLGGTKFTELTMVKLSDEVENEGQVDPGIPSGPPPGTPSA